MEFYISDKKYNYTSEELEYHLLSDNGIEGNVYRIGDRAVKIYKPICRKTRLKETEVDYLMKQNTKRLLLPKEKVFDSKRRFNGYTTELIQGVNIAVIARLKMKKLLEEMNLFKEDSLTLSKAKVLIDDLYLDNIILGEGLYSCDPGSYSINENMSEQQIEIENRYMINSLFIDELFKMGGFATRKEREMLKELTQSGEYLSDIFSWESIDDKESVSHFVKRMVKR